MDAEKRETNLEHLRSLEQYETAMVILNIAESQCKLCPRARKERCNEDCNNGLCEWLGKEYNPESLAWMRC